MVTRIYCDHCGHAAHNAQNYIFGSRNHFFGLVDPQHTNAVNSQQGGQLIGGQGQPPVSNQVKATGMAPTSPLPPVEIVRSGSVDLCDTCQIVWMNRVKALTQASEP